MYLIYNHAVSRWFDVNPIWQQSCAFPGTVVLNSWTWRRLRGHPAAAKTSDFSQRLGPRWTYLSLEEESALSHTYVPKNMATSTKYEAVSRQQKKTSTINITTNNSFHIPSSSLCLPPPHLKKYFFDNNSQQI